MANLINRKMFWALNDPKVIPCVVVAHDLKTARVTVLLDNGAKHETDAYDVRSTEQEAKVRARELRCNWENENRMATRYPNLI